MEYRAEGILLCPARGTRRDDLQQVEGIPSVLVTRYLPRARVNYVGADNVRGAAMAVDHLLEQGHRRIAFVGGAFDSSARKDRLRSCRRRLRGAGLDLPTELSVRTEVSRTGGKEAVLALLEGAAPPTAAVCYNDIVAIGVMLGLRGRGIVPGRDFAVVGFDDIEEAALWSPSLTTVATRPREVGRRAAQLLMEVIENPHAEPRRVLLDPELCIRESSTRSTGG
jgi:LacI family transcriptional regulator